MKIQTLRWFLAGVLLLLVFSCVDRNKANLEVSPQQISFEWNGGAKLLKISTEGDEWHWAESSLPNWITIRKTQMPYEVEIVVTPNPKDEQRETVLFLISENETVPVSIQQKPQPIDYYIKPEMTVLTVEDVAQDQEIKIETNVPKLEMIEAAAWLHASMDKQRITIRPENNETEQLRKGRIVLEAKGKQAIISISQLAKAYAKAEKKQLNFVYDGGKQVIKIAANCKLSVEHRFANQIFETQITDDGSLTVNIGFNSSPKELFGFIYLKNGSRVLETIAIRQEENKIEAEQRLYLKALYHATDGKNWTNNTNWLSDKPLSEWYGVKAGEKGVLTLNLKNNNLKGTIPQGVSALRYAYFINLSGNLLEGALPVGISQLRKLQSLNLSNNRFSGTIPSEYCIAPNKKPIVQLRGNRLSGIVPDCFLENSQYVCPQQDGYHFDNLICH